MIGLLGAAASFAGMVATPLSRRGGPVRAGAAGVVVAGLAVASFERIRSRAGIVRAGAAVTSIAAIGWSAEVIGTRTGRPFGPYSYSGRLRPEIGGVPFHVPMAWFAMAAPAREVAHAVLGHRSTPCRRVAVGSLALTAWDLFLDPQMTADGYWRWHRGGRYRGVPASNFVGWLLVGAVAVAALELTDPPGIDADPGLVAEYAGVAAMETLGFAAFFRDRSVAVAGGAAMLSLAVPAVRRVLGLAP